MSIMYLLMSIEENSESFQTINERQHKNNNKIRLSKYSTAL